MGENDRMLEQIAASLEAWPEILPFIPELLADLWSLGSQPDTIVDLLRPLGLTSGTTRVLDLGCGKGAVAVTLARELGFGVRGIDAFEPFVREARLKAEEYGVSGSCEFECGDLREVRDLDEPFDVVILASLGPVFGTYRETVRRIRRLVRPGGYVVIDDGFRADEAPDEVSLPDGYLSHDETLRSLTAHGDELVAEVTVPREEMARVNADCTELIRRRAARLAESHPALAGEFRRYVRNQEVECRIIDDAMTCAVWVLRRAGTEDA